VADALAVIAGQGSLPARVIGAARDAGRPVFVLAFEGITDPGLVEGVPHAWVGLGQIGKAVDALHASGARDVVMIGPVGRPSLGALKLDWRGIRLASRLGLAGQADNRVLRLIIDELEREGFRVLGADDVVGSLLMPSGPITRARPDASAEADIALGIKVAYRIGELDVGQAVVVQQGLVLGVEAIEGTDELLERCAGLRREGPGGVLVKVRKAGQDRRVDLPTIGPRTVAGAVRAGLRGIAAERGNSLIARRQQTVADANAAGLFIVGVAVDG
jgi:UDP-2,3-diacylglucosamine hydrolase